MKKGIRLERGGMKVIFDCNVIIAAGLKNGTCRSALIKGIELCDIYVTDEIIREYRDVIIREKFKKHKLELYKLLEIVCEVAYWTDPSAVNIVCNLPDKDDVIYLKAATSTQADYLITGNIKHFPQRKYENVAIITPADFFNLIKVHTQHT